MESGDETDIRIKRLIAFFKRFRTGRPKPGETDYSRWNQDEESYQQEQREWLASVRGRRAEEKERKDTDADRKSD